MTAMGESRGGENTNAVFRRFAQADVAPLADRIDREQRLPEELIGKLAARGYLAPWLPEAFGGHGMDWLTFGLLTEAIGHACSSTRSLLTVHGMVAQAILRFGTREQKAAYLPRLAKGEIIGALAVTEPDIGSDAAHPATEAIATADGYRVTGRKKWITFGQRADLFLVLSRCGGKPTALLIAADAPGLAIHPITGMLGTRGSMLAELEFADCPVPASGRLGREGLGFSFVASTALDHGRYSVAWGCVGLLRACVEAVTAYTSTRRQFGTEIMNHQLVRRLVTDMTVSLRCAELLCRNAAALRDAGDPRAVMETMICKYQASTAAMRAADDAVQLHGANGCSDRFPVARYLRDAKIMEIIEGSSQIQQLLIAKYAYQEHLPAAAPVPKEDAHAAE